MARRFTVHYMPKWESRPFLSPRACKHDPAAALVIGQRLERRRGRDALLCDCRICMDCGKVVFGGQSFVEAMQLAWAEYGWHRIIGLRLYGLVDHCKGVRWGRRVTWVPVWFGRAIGMTGQEIAHALAAAHGQLPPAAATDKTP